MNCKFLHTNILFYLDGELSQDEQRQTKEHLSQCESCKAFYQKVKDTYGMINEIPPLAGNFTEKVMQNIRKGKKVTLNKSFITFTRRIAAVILFMLASSSAAFLFMENQQREYTQTQNAKQEFLEYYFDDLDTDVVDNYYTLNPEND
ncbi:MAG: zf-HC2 domain-containing protein [Bacteroidales bacterium]